MTKYATKLASATDAATTFAHLTGARITNNHDYYGTRCAMTDEPWPVLVDTATGVAIVDFLPNEDGVGYYVMAYAYTGDGLTICKCVDELVTNAAAAVRFLLNEHLG